MCPRQVTRKDEGKLLRITNGYDVRIVRIFVVGLFQFTDTAMGTYNGYWWRAVSEGHK